MAFNGAIRQVLQQAQRAPQTPMQGPPQAAAQPQAGFGRFAQAIRPALQHVAQPPQGQWNPQGPQQPQQGGVLSIIANAIRQSQGNTPQQQGSWRGGMQSLMRQPQQQQPSIGGQDDMLAILQQILQRFKV